MPQMTAQQSYTLSAPQVRPILPVGIGPYQSNSDAAWARQLDDEMKKVEQRLRVWRRDISSLAREIEGCPPSLTAIERALELLHEFRAAVSRVQTGRPDRSHIRLRGMALEADGELTLEFDFHQSRSLTTRVERDGTIEVLAFRNRKLVQRERFHIGEAARVPWVA